MKAFMTLLLLTAPAWAQADIIKCQFTEPFKTTQYSMVQQSLTITDNIDGGREVIENVSFQIMGPGQFELWSRDHQVLQRLELNFGGSDGMSDIVFPYEVHWTAEGLHGGCTSNFLHAENPEFP